MTSFPPVIHSNTVILIVGTFPGVRSLEKQQYYGHPRNRLWQLVYDILDGRSPDHDYSARLDFLKSHKVGLWDILKTCRREGSLDQAIRFEEPNDFTSLLRRYTSVRRLLFNGQKAWYWFKKYQLKSVNSISGFRPEYLVMPSTSPAHAVKYEIKKQKWAEALFREKSVRTK